jgi:hypothetical protein
MNKSKFEKLKPNEPQKPYLRKAFVSGCRFLTIKLLGGVIKPTKNKMRHVENAYNKLEKKMDADGSIMGILNYIKIENKEDVKGLLLLYLLLFKATLLERLE